MKTNKQNKQEKQNSTGNINTVELKSRSEQLSGNSQTEKTLNTAKRIRPYVNFQQREENRALPTERVLELLRRWMPRQYELAEVVGNWIWITFTEQPAEQVRAELSQFGFHWNNARKCWQHPCGQFKTEGSDQDPREKYSSFMACAARSSTSQVAA